MATVSSKTFFGGQAPQEVPPVVAQQEPNYLQRVVGDFKTAGQNIVDTTTKLGSELAQQQNVPFAQQDFSFGTLAKRIGSALSTGIQTAGEFAGAMFTPVTEGVKPALEVTGLAEPVGQAVKTVTDTAPVQAAIEYYKTLDPETQKNLEALYNIVTAVAGTKALNFGSTVAPAALEVAGKAGGEAIGTLGAGAGKVAGKVLPTSEGIMQRVARIPKARQQAFEKTAGESVGKYLEKRGLFDAPDELVSKLYERFTQSRAAADEGLAKLPGTYKDATIGNALAQLLTREKAVSLPGVASKDSARVQQLVSKYRRGGLTMSEVNEVKRLFERNVKLGYQKSLSTQPEKIAQATNLDSKLREWQFNKAKELGFKELPDINKETQLARQLADDLGKEIAGTAGNNALGLTDAILVSGGDPAAIAMLITKKTAGSKAIQAKIAKLLSKEGEITSSTPSIPPTAQVSQFPSPKRNPDQIFPQVDAAIKKGITNYAKNPKLGLSIEDVSKPHLVESLPITQFKDRPAIMEYLKNKSLKEGGAWIYKTDPFPSPSSKVQVMKFDSPSKIPSAFYGGDTRGQIAYNGKIVPFNKGTIIKETMDGAYAKKDGGISIKPIKSSPAVGQTAPLLEQAKNYPTLEEFYNKLKSLSETKIPDIYIKKPKLPEAGIFGRSESLIESAQKHIDELTTKLEKVDKSKSWQGSKGERIAQIKKDISVWVKSRDEKKADLVRYNTELKQFNDFYKSLTPEKRVDDAIKHGALSESDRQIAIAFLKEKDNIKDISQLIDIWKQAHPESNFSPEVQRIINMTK